MNTDNKNCKIVMIAMFKNEAPVLRRMLDSTLGHCDYYVMQDNGSTDGSDQIASQFLQEHQLPGMIYKCEEGWQGFGWNRDHLIRYCQENVDHDCDWILKMDCDEVLEVDDDFDWTLLDDHSIHSFHVPAVSGSTIYMRCWLWNARMKWRFNHDPCHETIYCESPDLGESFMRVNLPNKIRQIGMNEGQSWYNPTKFVTDSLRLEDKLISEGTMLDRTSEYHFWYVGKSYFDASECPTLPLGMDHKREYARRAIWYFSQWLKHTLKDRAIEINEMAYSALLFSAAARRSVDQWEEAIVTYKQADQFAPMRNEHLVGLAECYRKVGRYDEMLAITTKLVEPSRTNPFPDVSAFIDNDMYYDTGDAPHRLHAEAKSLVSTTPNNSVPFIINKRHELARRMFIVDNFYANPDEVRSYALNEVEYEGDIRWYKGLRSKTTYRPQGLKEAFEHIMGRTINDFDSGFNGVFQITMSNDQQVYHYDTQKWAAMIYLTPDAPVESGTRLHKSKNNGTRHRDEPGSDDAFNGDFYNSTQFEITDAAANIYNRLVIMDAGCFHSAGPYFGNTKETGRLVHLFFFD
jgi:glycosyltransferase involved in cell wall biosynthesis